MSENKEEINNVKVEEISSEQIEQVKVINIPNYQLCESIFNKTGEIVSIMNLQLEQLIFEKMYLLFEKLRISENNLESAKIELEIEKNRLLLETDFEKELGKSRTNKDERMAVIKPFLAKFEEEVDNENSNVIFYKDKLSVINDLIKKERLLLRIGGDLKE